MSENDPPGKKRWEWLKLKPSRSDPHLPEERPTSDTSSLPPSSNESRGRPRKLVRKLFGKVTKPFAPSARQSSNPEPTGASSSADIQPVPVQSIENPSPLIVATPELNIEQSSNPGIVKAGQPDQKFVNERITDATDVFAGIGHVTTIAQHTSSAANNLQSVSDTVDTFSALLGPLKVFNSIVMALPMSIPTRRWR
ncbi:hypothetical protein DEU56DRAFT_417427 [Suillus clintonianus]|uniref:uncharacterized protein n=1 Tax=Suillus clintonianus TaxID=1904413 RepID=UPI001B85C3A5|nr:uncharacterized protein DEU56DRAFT_417427 [Suillus clintonianus]KAG2133777.1 hypothetical protein DEU56DRAFT_417427 [Suillus clintonianus]